MPLQLDLLSWDPGEIVRQYDETRVRAASLRSRIARSVAETLRDCGRSRAEVARRMSVFLGSEISKPMLDAYASEAREGHSISFERLIALVDATGDVRPLQMAAALFDHSVVDDRYLPWIEVGKEAAGHLESKRRFSAALNYAQKAVRR